MAEPTVTYVFVPSPEHALDGHPESPVRFRNLTADAPLDLPIELTRTNPAPLQGEDLAVVHNPDYLSRLEEVVNEGHGVLDHGDTYFTPDSMHAARRAAGAAVAVTDACLGTGTRLGLSIARPPGHHATRDRALGFCLLNNIAIAARFAQSEGIERVMIVDFDVHHGNGTQEIFYDDPSVLYVSFHQWGIFPGTGSLDERGAGDGFGATVNVPLPAGVGQEGYLRLSEALLPRLADRFQPELLLLSGGFDGHWKDPLAGLQLTVQTYYELGRLFRSIAQQHCQGRAAYIQEGGYNAQVLARGLHEIVRGLAGLESIPEGAQPRQVEEPDISELMDRIMQLYA